MSVGMGFGHWREGVREKKKRGGLSSNQQGEFEVDGK